MFKKVLASSVVSLMSVGFYALPVMADTHQSDDILVKNTNDAYVKNVVDVTANSGWNQANGGNTGGSDGGDGGMVSNSGDSNEGGAGGDAGDAGVGGIITTGNAEAGAVVENKVNLNKTKIDGCECEETTVDDVTVKNRNNARVKNRVTVKADTGNNTADGGYAGGSAGNGGDVSNSGDSNDGGDGGNGGEAGMGGDILTGDSLSGASVLNVVNRNVTRIRR